MGNPIKNLAFGALMFFILAGSAMAYASYPPRTGGDYSGPDWYGYFANEDPRENSDHTNITEIWATFAIDILKEPPLTRAEQLNKAKARIISRLEVARQEGVKAMVDVGAIVFRPEYRIEAYVENGEILYRRSNKICYHENPSAAADFQGLVQTLKNNGYLVSNDPENSAVISFYVADEPEINCLGDSGLLTPNENVVVAVNAIRQNADTTNFPLVTIVGQDKYFDFLGGASLFDWVGLDDYHSNVWGYRNHFTDFMNAVKYNDLVGGTPQHFFLVPLVTDITDEGNYVEPYEQGAYVMRDMYSENDDIIGILPFRWDDNNGGGIAGTDYAVHYIQVGKEIVARSEKIGCKPCAAQIAARTHVVN